MPTASAACMTGCETAAEAAVKTVAEAAVKTVAEAMVEMWKLLRYHDCRSEPKQPRIGRPIRIVKRRIGII